MANVVRIFFALAISFLLSACGNSFTSKSSNSSSSSQISGTLKGSIEGLEYMEGQHYEGWWITSQGPISSGRFAIDPIGNVFEVNSSGDNVQFLGEKNDFTISSPIAVDRISAFVLTIEPNNDSNPGPSSVHVVAGEFSNGSAIATTEHPSAIGASFSNANGVYILATPSNSAETANQGIWNINPTTGGAGLNLPTLANGWVYEGWIVNTATGEVLSTGTFLSADQADSDGAGAAAGPNATPNIPGQDYINPARILNDGNYKTVITVEPEIDFDPAPFALKILAHDIPLDLPVATATALDGISNEASIRMVVSLKE